MTRLAAQIGRDLLYGVRSIRRTAMSSATVVTVLALGIGANAAVFSVINTVLLQPLPYPAPDRLVQVFCGSPIGRVLAASVPKFVAWRDQRGLFQYVAAFTPVEPMSVAIGGPPEPTAAVHVSADYFPVFGVKTVLGRVLTSAKDVPDGPKRALISERLWRWLPLEADPSSIDHSSRLQVVARLWPHVTPEVAARQLRDATDHFDKMFPDALGPLEFFSAAPLRDIIVADARPTLMFLLGAVVFVLLISCANVANLLLARQPTAFGNRRPRRARRIARTRRPSTPHRKRAGTWFGVRRSSVHSWVPGFGFGAGFGVHGWVRSSVRRSELGSTFGTRLDVRSSARRSELGSGALNHEPRTEL